MSGRTGTPMEYRATRYVDTNGLTPGQAVSYYRPPQICLREQACDCPAKFPISQIQDRAARNDYHIVAVQQPFMGTAKACPHLAPQAIAHNRLPHMFAHNKTVTVVWQLVGYHTKNQRLMMPGFSRLA
jgi:hypothetical protein